MPENEEGITPEETSADLGAEQLPEWASEEVDIPGMNKRMKVEDLLKSYPESVNQMRAKEREALQARQEAEQYKSWATPIQERYWTDPEFRSGFDELVSGNNSGIDGAASQQAAIPSVVSREIAETRAEIESLKQERAFQSLKERKLPLDKDMELEILHEVQITGLNDIEAHYWKLYGEKVRDLSVKEALARQAEELAKNRGVYNPPPRASGTRNTQKNPDEMTTQERESAALQKLIEMGF